MGEVKLTEAKAKFDDARSSLPDLHWRVSTYNGGLWSAYVDGYRHGLPEIAVAGLESEAAAYSAMASTLNVWTAGRAALSSGKEG